MHEPTCSPDDKTPTTCWCCSRHAIGVGVGNPGRSDPRFLCAECVMLMETLKHLKRLDPYEVEALNGGIAAAGRYLKQEGVTDLAEMDELQAQLLVKCIWMGCADEMRKIIREKEVPF